jgi:hypothetical protein
VRSRLPLDDVEVRVSGVAEASALGLIVIPGLLELLDEQRADRHDGDAALPGVGERLGDEDLRQATTAELLIDDGVVEDPLGLGLGAGEEVGVAGDGAALDRDGIGPAVLVEGDGDLGARRVRECLDSLLSPSLLVSLGGRSRHCVSSGPAWAWGGGFRRALIVTSGSLGAGRRPRPSALRPGPPRPM